MIDEQETRLQFGYYSESLSHGSDKKVYAICEGCGNRRIMKFYSYVKTHGRCNSCAKSGKNHPMFGKHPTEETKDKISKANSGENHPMFGQTGENNPMFGKTGKNNPHWKGGKKLSRARNSAKRRELFGFIPHNKPQNNFHGHHLDFNHVIFIPVELHRSVWHSVVKNINMCLINNAVCDWYLKNQGVTL